MKKIVGIITAGIMAISLGACGTANDRPQVTNTVTATPTPSEDNLDNYTLSDNEFADLVRQNADAFADASTDDIVTIARGICNQWAAGATLEDIGMLFVKYNIDVQDGGFLAGAGTANYCPQYNDKLVPSGSDVTTS